MILLTEAAQARAPLIGLARLATAAFQGQDLAPVCQALIGRAQADAEDGNALLDLAYALQLSGRRDLGLGMLRAALDKQHVFTLPASKPAALRVLLLLVPGDLAQNNTVEFLTANSDITLLLAYVEGGLPAPDQLPEHDVLMVAACESAANRSLLLHVAARLLDWPRPVINQAGRLLATGRDDVSRALAGIDGLRVPTTVRLARGRLQAVVDGQVALADVADGVDFPCIVRPVDSQKGSGLKRVDSPAELAAFLAADTAAHCYVAPYVDYRSADGCFRKYRVLLIDGRAYLCHVAISEHWVVHYMSAGMTAADELGDRKRAEEARCMQAFDSAFLPQHGAALAAIAERVGLEYVGVDCGVGPAGELLLFEVDAGMTVHAMDPASMFPYKQPQMAKVFAAFRDMLLRRTAAA